MKPATLMHSDVLLDDNQLRRPDEGTTVHNADVHTVKRTTLSFDALCAI